MVFLSQVELKNLDKWVYNVKGVTILDSFMRKWWNIAFRFVPITTSPDTITLIGFISGVLSTLLCVYYSLDLTQEVPHWVYAACGFGLFFYQTMDALDGKQCRKTGRNTGVEELYDHGCDSVSSVLQYIATTLCLQLGKYPSTWVWLLFVGNFTFFSVHWRTYVTDVHHVGKIDHTETQLLAVFLMFATSIKGPQFWETQVYGEFTLKELIVFGTILTGVWKIIENCSSALWHHKSIRPVSTILVGHILFALSFNAIQHWIKSQGALVLFGLFLGLFVAKQDQRIVVTHLVQSKMTFLDISLLPVGIFALIANFTEAGYFTWISLIICCLFSLIDMVRYFTGVTTEIAQYHGIEIFRIKDSDPRFFDNLIEDHPDPNNKPLVMQNGNGHLKAH